MAVIALLLCMASAAAFISALYTRQAIDARKALNFDQAEKDFRVAMRFGPGNWKPVMGLAHLYKTRAFWNLDTLQKEAQAHLASTLYAKAYRENSGEMEILYGNSRIMEILGHPETAAALLKQIINEAPHAFFYRKKLARLYEKYGDYPEALEVWQSLYEITPEKAPIRKYIQRVKKQIKNNAPEPTS